MTKSGFPLPEIESLHRPGQAWQRGGANLPGPSAWLHPLHRGFPTQRPAHEAHLRFSPKSQSRGLACCATDSGRTLFHKRSQRLSAPMLPDLGAPDHAPEQPAGCGHSPGPWSVGLPSCIQLARPCAHVRFRPFKPFLFRGGRSEMFEFSLWKRVLLAAEIKAMP